MKLNLLNFSGMNSDSMNYVISRAYFTMGSTRLNKVLLKLL